MMMLWPKRGPRGRMRNSFDHLVGGASSIDGTVRLSALAVLRLMINSSFVGACTGKSAGYCAIVYSAEIHRHQQRTTLTEAVPPASDGTL